MKKLLFISAVLGTLVYGQKNNQSSQLSSKVVEADLGTNSVSETVPRRLSYQGLLTKANGRAVTDGTYQVTFRLYRDLEGGTAFWEETQNIGIEDGIVTATLGSSVPINSIPSDAYLEIDIDGTVLSPRQEMTSVFYSVVSDTAKYAEAGSYLNLDDLPDLSAYATKDTLTTFVQSNSLDSVAYTGSYNDLVDLPDLSEILELDTLGYYAMSDSLALYTLTTDISDSLALYTLTMDLASVALSNDYNDLSNLPDLTQYAALDTLGSYVSSDTLVNFVITDSLGTIAEQNADNVVITGGSVIGITDIAIADGGTGASDNSTARSNLGLEIGVDVQAHDADLVDLADGSLSAEKVEYLENVTSDVQAQINAIGDGPVNSLEDLGVTADSTELNYVDGVTSNIQDQLDAKQDLNANLTTLAGLDQNHDHFIVSDGTNWTIEAGADARQSLGLGSIATQEADNVIITGGSVTDITDIAIADGGTGASDITTARENLGLEIGVDVQGYDADLTDLSDGTLTASKVQYLENVTSDVQVQLDSKGTGNVSTLADLGVTSDATEVNYTDGVTSNIQDQLDAKMDTNTELATISGLAHSDGNIIVSDGSSWTVETGAVARTSLGLGSIATQAADNVSITGGSVSGITDLAIADGGTNASDVSEARSNLGLEIGVDVQAYDADLADLADGKLTATKVQHGEYFITTDGTNGQVWTSDGDGPGAWGDIGGITGAATTIDTEDLTASRAIISNTDGKIAVSEVTTTELGYVDGVTSNVQTQLDNKQDKDDHLSDIADLSHADGNFIVSNGSKWTVENGSDARTSLGLGTIATQAANNVAITGGSVTGITDITVADGGTGASDVSTARSNLGLEIGVDVQAYDADLADLADGTLSASKVENNEYFITSAGTSGQVWTSDGDGVGDWAANSAATDIDGLSDAKSGGDNFSNSIIIGHETTGTLNNANNNTAVGVNALDAITSGDANTAFGLSSLTALTTGNYNAAQGAFSLRDLTSGTHNVAMGNSSLRDVTSGLKNSGLGQGSAFRVTTGDFNVGLGFRSGDTLTTGNNNVIVGGFADASKNDASNQIVLGHRATGQADNSVTLGNADVTAVYMSQDKGATVYAAALGFGSTSMTLPTTDGSSDQVLKTNGSGTLSWGSAATSINGLSDALVEDTGSMYVGNDPSSTTDAADYNVAVGVTALDAITTGDANTAIGYDVLTDNTTGEQNTASGYRALKLNESGSYNTATGYEALFVNTNSGNSAFGWRSLRNNTSGTYNTASGYQSLGSNTEGDRNIAFGYRALFDNTTADFNTAIGVESLYDANRTADQDGYNSALGYQAGNTGTNDITTGNKNTFVGASTAASDEAGTNQTIVGYGASGQADNSVTLGNADVTAVYMSQDKGATVYAAALGFGSTAMTLPTADGSANQLLKTDGSGTLAWTSASSLTSINTLSDALIEDTGSMYVGNDPSSTTDGADYNLAVSTTALDAITTGDSNTAVGYDALTDNTAGSRNTAIGAYALKDNTTGIVNVAVGSSALDKNTTGNSNTAVGHSSAYSLTSGSSNVSMGWKSAFTVETGNNNVIIGAEANPSTDGGSSNQVVIGQGTTGQADNSVTLGNADVTAVYMSQDKGATVYAAALGFGSTAMTLPTADGSANQLLKTDGSGTLAWTSASSLTSINTLSDALIEDTGSMYVGNDPSSTTDGADYNLAVGTTALDAITTGDQNTVLGYDAMTANTTGSYNTALGYKSLESNESGHRNIAIGMQSLQANSSGDYNTAVGMYSLYASATAAYNTAMGFNALKLANRTADTDGYNTALGYNAGTTGTNDITTGNKNTLLGASTAAASAAGTNQTVIGYGASGQADNSVTLGNADVTAIYMSQDQGATVYAAGVDITGSSGLILENDETITNSTDGTILIDGKADFNDNAITGYGADLQTESGTSKTLAASDNGTIIVCSSNSAITITVPASLPSGFNCMIIQNGSGQVSLSASSTTLNNRNGSKTAGQYAILTLVHLGSNIFVVSGDTSS